MSRYPEAGAVIETMDGRIVRGDTIEEAVRTGWGRKAFWVAGYILEDSGSRNGSPILAVIKRTTEHYDVIYTRH